MLTCLGNHLTSHSAGAIRWQEQQLCCSMPHDVFNVLYKQLRGWGHWTKLGPLVTKLQCRGHASHMMP
jgi:hypothetical protein